MAMNTDLMPMTIEVSLLEYEVLTAMASSLLRIYCGHGNRISFQTIIDELPVFTISRPKRHKSSLH
jgi:hypothetical protein